MRFVPIILLFLFARIAVAQPDVLTRVWQSQDGLPSNVVRSVVQSADGYLWMATAEGVTRFDGYDFQVYEPEGDLRRSRMAFYRLFTTPGGGVWAATYQGGLFRVEGDRLSRVVRNTRQPNPLLVSQLIETGDGMFHFRKGDLVGRVAGDGSVSVIAPDDALLEQFRLDLERQQDHGRIFQAGARPVLRDSTGRIWKAGVTGGLSVAEESGPATAVELPARGEAFVVNELMEDREGNVWVASSVNGLIRVRHARVDVLDTNQGHSERAVSALMQDHTGAWWIANRRGGLDRWTPEETRFVPLSTSSYSRPAAALFEDRDDRLWVASRDGSVFRLEPTGFKPQFARSQVPSKVRSIAQDAAGLLWFGGTQGLASFDGERVRQYGQAEGVEPDDFTVIQPFPDGRVIAGSALGRIVLGGTAGFRTLATPAVTRHQWVSGILTFSPEEIWVSTLGSGLYLWDGKRWTAFDADDGLPDSRLTCLLDDGQGAIWSGSLGGIIRAERKSLLAHARDPDSPVRWLLLDHTDGLPSRECIGGYQPAGWRARNGMLWFPTGSGIARVRPDIVPVASVRPPIYLQSVRANGELFAPGSGPITAGPGRSRLEFRFVGLGFSAPEKVTNRGRLAGLDDTWRELGSQRVAAFEAVPPGRYVFQVMAVNGDGLRSAAPAEVAITIRPNFWETAWFSVGAAGLVLLVAVGSGWLAARVRLKRRIQLLKIRHAREGERARIARDLHDDLGASLTEISILAALAAEDAEKSPLQPSLDQLSVKAKHVVGSLDEIVWAVNPREDTLRSLVDYIAAFAREFLDIARIPLRSEVERSIPERPLATAQRHGVFLAAREALNNIVKHSGATEVKLTISVRDGVLEIHLQDNGRGFDPSEVAGGNGLGNLRQRMRDAGGDCHLESRRRHGTSISLTLPLPAPAKPVS